MSPETNPEELLSDDRPIETASTIPPPQAAIYEHELDAGPLGVASAVLSSVTAAPPDVPDGVTLRELRAVIANAANACARLSRTPGAPVLTADSPREDVIGWLTWNDPNGLYTDDALRAEDEDPLTLDGAWEELARIDLDDAAGAKVSP